MTKPVTSPPSGDVPVALYDGHCRFCTTWAARLHSAARGGIVILSFQDPGVLERFPGVRHEDCMRELKLVDREGRVFGGAEAVVRAIRAGRPLLGRLALIYYVPGLRQLAERAYAWVARRRYRLFGRSLEACTDDSCAIHPR